MPSWGHSQSLVSARNFDCISAVSQNTNIVKTACVIGKIFNNSVHVLLDSGASCSVIHAQSFMLPTSHTLI